MTTPVSQTNPTFPVVEWRRQAAPNTYRPPVSPIGNSRNIIVFDDILNLSGAFVTTLRARLAAEFRAAGRQPALADWLIPHYQRLAAIARSAKRWGAAGRAPDRTDFALILAGLQRLRNSFGLPPDTEVLTWLAAPPKSGPAALAKPPPMVGDFYVVGSILTGRARVRLLLPRPDDY